MGEPLTSLLCLARFPTLPLPPAPVLPQIQGSQHNSISGTLRARYDLSLLTQLTSTATETFPLGAQLAGAGKQGTAPLEPSLWALVWDASLGIPWSH